MAARRAKGEAMRAHDDDAREAARARVDAAKVALGERGPVWWSDGAPDLTRHLARTGPYAAWFAALAADDDPTAEARERGRRARGRGAADVGGAPQGAG